MPVFAKVVSYFEEVARRGSIRRAAEYLHVTASAVDRQILLLEERVGTPLFERLPRGVRLTAAGELMLRSVRHLAKVFDSTVSEVEALRGLRHGHVTVCGLQFLGESVFPRFIRETREQHPGISISAFVGTTEEILRDVINGDADFGICYAPQGRLPVTTLRSLTLRMGAVVAPGHPLTSLAKVRLADCMEYPLVLPRREMELRSRIERIQTHSAIELRPTIETNSIGMMKTILRDGLGGRLPDRGRCCCRSARWATSVDSVG
ncbi:LysR family transcriptional regulator [Undibacterium arcticum]